MEMDDEESNHSLSCSISGNTDSENKNLESDIPVLEHDVTQHHKEFENENYESDLVSSLEDRFHIPILDEQVIESEHENHPEFGFENENTIHQENGEAIEANLDENTVVIESDELSGSEEGKDEEEYVPSEIDEEVEEKCKKINKIPNTVANEFEGFPPSEEFEYGIPDEGFTKTITPNNLNRQTNSNSNHLTYLNPKQSGSFQTHKSYQSPALAKEEKSQERAENNIIKEGRQYSEKEKRMFVKKVLDEMKKQSPEQMKEIVRAAAHHAEIQVYVMKTWINAYKIVFNIEAIFREKKLQPDMSLKKLYIENEMRSYAAKNKNEKRYRIIKVVSLIFQIFNIIDSPSTWYNAFEKKYKKEIESNHVNLDKNQKVSKKDFENREFHEVKKIDNQNNFCFEPKGEEFGKISEKREDKKKEFLQKQQNCDTKVSEKKTKPLKTNSESVFTPIQPKIMSGYPIAFQKKICSSLDELVEQNLNEAFKSMSSEYCLSFDILKQIYFDHGAISFRKKEMGLSKSIEKFQPPPINPIDNLTLNEKKVDEKNSLSNKKIIDKPKIVEKPIQKLQIPTNTQTLQKIPPSIPPVQNTLNAINIQTIQKVPQKLMETQEKNTEVKNNNSSQIQSQEVIQDKNQLLKRLEKQLLSFLQSKENCTIISLQNENERLMADIGFSQSLKVEVRTQWFAMFLKFNRYYVNPEKKVVKVIQNQNGNLFLNGAQSGTNISAPNLKPGLEFQSSKIQKGPSQIQQLNGKSSKA